MTDTTWETLALTPWWFYVLILYILYVSFQITKPRTVSLRSFILYPAIFIVLFLSCLAYLVPFTLKNIAIWLGMILVGVFLGWWQFRAMKVEIIKEKSQLHLPGSWIAFITVVIVIFAKFYFLGRQILLDTSVLQQEKFAMFAVAIGGLITGLYLGRLIYIRKRLK